MKNESQPKSHDKHKATESKGPNKKKIEGNLSIQNSVKIDKITEPSQQKSTDTKVKIKKEEDIKNEKAYTRKEQTSIINKTEDKKSNKPAITGIKKTPENKSTIPLKRKISSSSEESSSDESNSSSDEPTSITLNKKFCMSLINRKKRSSPKEE